MRSRLVKSIESRLITEISCRNPLKFLKDFEVEDYIDEAIASLYLYTRVRKNYKTNKITTFFTEVACTIGHDIRNKYKLKVDSTLAAKTGAFILYSFEKIGITEVNIGSASNGHSSYLLTVLDGDALAKLFEEVEIEKVEKLPSTRPFAPWTSVKHEAGRMLVKTKSSEVLKKLSPRTHPMIFKTANKSQNTGWEINKEVLKLQEWCLSHKEEAFEDIWQQTNRQAYETKLREAESILSIAKAFIGKTFFHLYVFDFRFRKYTNTAYLHEQGSDMSRGLLLTEKAYPIRKRGFLWLLISLAGNWGGDCGRADGLTTDKIPIKDSIQWAKDNEEMFLDFGENPKKNRGWMKADKPWQFIAACIELRKLREWQWRSGDELNPFEDYGYKSRLEAFIDGSNNGCQHLAALAKDEVTGKHVNLTKSELPGDLYKFLAEKVWKKISNTVKTMPKVKRDLYETVVDRIIAYKIDIASKSGFERELAIDEFRKYKEGNCVDILSDLSAVYWNRIEHPKERRKIIKRNIMTLPYGVTVYGLVQQIIDDAGKHHIKLLLNMEHAWGSYLGKLVYSTCKRHVSKLMKLLEVFEKAGARAESMGEFLSWTVPITNAPVVQYYTEGEVIKKWIQYGPPRGPIQTTKYYKNTLQLHVCHIEKLTPSKGKQALGASPNIIHSLDAAHLMMIVDRCDFNVTTIHDSFGAALCNMPRLYKATRDTFVELHSANPLEKILNDIGGDVADIEFGTLDIEEVKRSQFCFR